MTQIVGCIYQSPVGQLQLAERQGRICMCDWVDSPRHTANVRVLGSAIRVGNTPLLQEAVTQLRAYFDGKLTEFDIALEFSGTSFQQAVRRSLLAIPYGTTQTYTEQASLSGHPHAVRAVATAIATNPVSIILPCHRVIGSDGALRGYAGGLPAKQYLLMLEDPHIIFNGKLITKILCH